MASVDPTPEPTPEPDARPSRHVEVVPWYRSPAFVITAFAAVAVLLIVLIILAVRNTNADPTTAPTPLHPSISISISASPSPSPSPDSRISRATVLKTQFVEPFRIKFPKFSGERTDATIADTGVLACNLLLEEDVTRAGANKRLASLLDEGDNLATEANVKDVAQLAVMNTCPDRQKAFIRVFGS